MALKGHIFNLDVDAKSKKLLSDRITQNGGTVSYIAGPLVTHYVASPDTIAKNGYKIQAAKKNNTKIVTPSYLTDTIDAYVPEEAPEEDATELGSLVVYKPQNQGNVPVIRSVLPCEGKIGSTFKVSLMGENFKPSTDMRIKFGSYVCQDIEYHCPTVVVANVRAQNFVPGEVMVSASNNGQDFGNSVSFTFLEGEDVGIQSWHRKELQTLRNKIFQLQADILDVQRIEFNLSVKFEEGAVYPAPTRPAITQGEPQTAQPRQRQPKTIQPRIDKKEVLQIREKMVKAKEPEFVDDSSREARIFISSPFKDMNEERDLIVKRIIPKLRKLCLERDIVLTCVDLRWGVTEAQTQGAATLLMCLREIEKCNIFIGLYGERYGWCMSENSYRKPSPQDELLLRTFGIATKEFPWINQFKDRSVTEIEMRMIIDSHAKDMHKEACFYLRDPYYVESIPIDKRQDFVSEGEYEKGKLDQLKNDIQKSGYTTGPYHRPTHLGELIFDDLNKIINKRYPTGTELNPFKRERFLHSTFGRSLTRVFLPQESLFMNLDRFASSNTVTPLVVFGEAGVGKSAVLANWSKRYKQHHPEVIVVEHWIGCTGKSSNYLCILRRIMDELQDYLNDTTEDIPQDPKEMEKLFPSWLERTLNRNKVNRVVLMIDGLDNLEESNNSHTLLWLPQRFPACVRLILSTAPSRPLQMLQKRNYETMEVLPIEEGERASFIRQYLNMNSKKLSEAQEHKIAKCKQTGNPRYLKVLLEDISIWGQFEQLDKRIDNDLKAQDTSQLYEIVLERLEKDYDKDGKETVKSFMCFVWASRRGLMVDTELAFLMEKNRVDYNTWQTLFLGVDDLFISSGGLLNFVNKDIRRAVEQRYLKNTEARHQFHTFLAEYFDKSLEGLVDRKVDELAYQYFNAEDWVKLHASVTHLGMFNKLYSHQKFDLFKYWRALESKYDIVDSYTTALERGDTLPADVLQGDLYYQVGRFLDDMAKFDGATKVFVKARSLYNNSSQNLAVAKTDLFLATIMTSQAKYKEAEELFQKCLSIYTRESGEDDLTVATVLRKLGDLYLTINHYEKSEECFQKALRITKSKLGSNHWKVAKILTIMTNFYARQGQNEMGLDCGKQALKIAEEEFGPDDGTLTPILAAIGRITMQQKNFDESKQVFKRALKITEEKYGKDHPKTGDILYELGAFFFVKPEELTRLKTNVAEKFKQKGYWEQQNTKEVALLKGGTEKENKKSFSLDRAEKLFLQSLSIFENAYGNDHPDIARVLTRLGSLYIERVQYLKAAECLEKSLSIYMTKLGPLHSRVGQTYKHLFTLYNLQEKLEESKECGKKALAVLRHIRGEESIEVSNVYERLGDQCANAGLKDEAKEYFTKAKAIRTALLGSEHKDTVAIDVLLNSLTAPPPPPPPPVAVTTVEELLQQANVEITTEMKQQRGREDLLDAIKNFGKMKEQLQSAESAKKRQKKAAFEEEKKGWWRQNYQAGFDAKQVKAKAPVLSKVAAKPQQQAMTKPVAPIATNAPRAPPPPPKGWM